MRSPFVIASLAALLGLGLLGGVGEEADAQRSAIEPLPRSTAPPAGLTPDELANIRVYDAANRSVVNISTSTIQRDRMFGLTVEGEGAGSGAILDRDGHILTNLHVIENAREVRVTLANDNQYDAVLVGADQ
ncbi:MAG: trypsin-like peptidase domain-containing protein, partial [Planctomycetota bacterium]